MSRFYPFVPPDTYPLLPWYHNWWSTWGSRLRASSSLPVFTHREAVSVWQVFISSDAALSSMHMHMCSLVAYPMTREECENIWEEKVFPLKIKFRSCSPQQSMPREGMKKRKWVMFAILLSKQEACRWNVSRTQGKVEIAGKPEGKRVQEESKSFFNFKHPSSKWPRGPLVHESLVIANPYDFVCAYVSNCFLLSRNSLAFSHLPLFSCDMEKCPHNSRIHRKERRRKYNVKLASLFHQ